MLKELFQQKRVLLDYFFQELDIASAEKFFERCMATQGLLLFTGVGKSGLVAEKIAMTLISSGTKALFLPPSNLLHGDIGIAGPKDLFVMLSKSGETEELLDLIPFVRKTGSGLCSLVSNPHSRLAKASDLFVYLPMQRELCPFDLVPTTSTAVQLHFGDVLAVALMKKKEISLEKYACSHPAGTIGKKIHLRVADVMLKGEKVPLCAPEERLINLLPALSSKGCGCLLVVNARAELLGIFTDGDLRRALQTYGGEILEKTIDELMIHSPLVTSASTLAIDAAKLMQRDSKKWIQVLPVVDENRLVGLLRMHDIIHVGLS